MVDHVHEWVDEQLAWHKKSIDSSQQGIYQDCKSCGRKRLKVINIQNVYSESRKQ